MSQNSLKIRYFQRFHEPSEFIQILIHHDFLHFTLRIPVKNYKDYFKTIVYKLTGLHLSNYKVQIS